MRWLAVIGLVGCGFFGDGSGGELSSEDFSEQFAQKACDAFHQCDPSISCDGGSGSTTEDVCEFDPDAARLCLDGVYTCDDSAGFPLLEFPDACLDVYSCGDTSFTYTVTGTVSTTI